MRKAVKVVDFHGFFVLVHATRNVKKRIISFQKRDPFLQKGKKGHAKADKSHKVNLIRFRKSNRSDTFVKSLGGAHKHIALCRQEIHLICSSTSTDRNKRKTVSVR